MKKLPVYSLAFIVGLGLLTILPLPAAVAQEAAALKEGIALYNQEDFEEAIEMLTKVREQDPASADAAFYLGMAYRQLNDLTNAYRQFEDAVGLKPLSDNAILQMIEVATLVDKLDVARKWIAAAEQNQVYPARVAFLKGSALAKETRYAEAIASFERAKQLDPSYTQSADFQIGICYMSQRQYTKARDLFQSAVTMDPLSDTASYARRYQEAAEQWRYIERPLRLTVGITGQYDTNYRTLGFSYDLAPAAWNTYIDSTDKPSLVLQNLVRLDFVPILPAPFVFNAGYAAMNVLHQKYGTDNDTFANSFSLAPGLNYESFAVNLVANYTHNLKRDNSYRRYSEVSSIGPLFRFLLAKDHILELNGYFTRKNFFRAPAIPEEDQTSQGLDSAASWIWLYGENSLFSLKLGYTQDNADGRNYDNQGYRASVSLIQPLVDALRLQVGGEVYLQDYSNENALFNNVKRKDRSYTGTIGLTWSVIKHLDLIAQYLFTRVDSNIYAYDYQRELVSLGMELKF
jgi:Flp pilus assembly protein TadD